MDHVLQQRQPPAILLEGVEVTLPSRAGPVAILRGIDLKVPAGEALAIVGPSGSGKSTLLMIVAGLERATSGRVEVVGADYATLDEDGLARLRAANIGIVFQSFHLVPTMTAIENVALPLEFLGDDDAYAKAHEALGEVGLSHRETHFPGQLSGGEQQRVSIAVALANGPKVLFADEPTGELDAATGSEVFETLKAVNDAGTTIVVVTHDPLVAHHVQRTVAIRDGRTSSEVLRWTEIDEEGQHRVMAEEYVVVDRVGRMQLPHDYMEELNIKNRARLTLDPDHVKVFPDKDKPKDD